MTTVVVSAGTYHLPFDRLTRWVGEWYEVHPEVDLVVQHGPSAPVAGAINHATLPYTELLRLCQAADVVVLQGGAGGVMDMNRLSVIPIVVPRIPVDDEVVDDHQLVFTAEMARIGAIHRATSAQELATLLDKAVAGTLASHAVEPVAAPGIAALDLLELPDRPIPLRRVLRRGLTLAFQLVTRRGPTG